SPLGLPFKMAQAGVFLEHDQFNCSICLDVLKDPVTIPCGHSYCKSCIKNYWDQDDYLGIYGCPQCRQSFTPRPVLGRNTMLADVVEKLKKTGLHAWPTTEPTQAEAGDVECDVCSGAKNKAFKSCLVCLASFCQTHLQPHYESFAFQKHKLVSPSKKIQEQLCARHDKLLENSLAELRRVSQQRIEAREQELADLKQASQTLTLSAQSALEEIERVFTELVCSIERRRTEVTELIRNQERAAVNQTQTVIQELEQEISELRMRDGKLAELSHTEDHIAFLQNYKSVCSQPESAEVPSFTPKPDFSSVITAVSEFQALLEDVCQGGFVNISEKVSDVTILQSMTPKNDPEANRAFAPVFGMAAPVPFAINAREHQVLDRNCSLAGDAGSLKMDPKIEAFILKKFRRVSVSAVHQ
ncbi:hypothetical protein DNTS_025635, partial [Danionella cerebrum]